MTAARDDRQAQACDILHRLGIPHGQSFHALPTDRVDALLAEADLYRYRRPRNANGSRARYFHDMLQRRATAA